MSDDGVVVVGTLTKVAISLALLGTVGYDTISMASTTLAVRDDAQTAAELGHQALRDGGTPATAFAAVLKYARSRGDSVVASGFRTGEKNTVTVELRRAAQTIAASYLPKVNTYVVASSTATASDPIH